MIKSSLWILIYLLNDFVIQIFFQSTISIQVKYMFEWVRKLKMNLIDNRNRSSLKLFSLMHDVNWMNWDKIYIQCDIKIINISIIIVAMINNRWITMTISNFFFYFTSHPHSVAVQKAREDYNLLRLINFEIHWHPTNMYLINNWSN